MRLLPNCPVSKVQLTKFRQKYKKKCFFVTIQHYNHDNYIKSLKFKKTKKVNVIPNSFRNPLQFRDKKIISYPK